MQACSSFSTYLPFESGGDGVLDAVHEEVESDAAHPQHHRVVCKPISKLKTRGEKAHLERGRGERGHLEGTRGECDILKRDKGRV